ncbi:hypothetical protein COY90_03475 [Candidatus Roizmanbacteria bacterium CG_4_10_14_0_8_um_filter_39_9]|uniref:Uncharacterized protein n=1 Tax=Candidatus Roizmanbacteria bacterium CG_4_10_14_0_8_um_filter_39_9 TaxID=1974829 RepID=A0A2M7QDE6_9BACT|nr:MAG: hypothetical protein COY90_03475 [Candidatus Roizmanbacteria bacterium CG_4_10_14_0_8_um_filter_39_9]
MATTGHPENRGRKMSIKWQYIIPALIFLVALTAGCSPTPAVLPSTLDPVNVPPSSSPIYSNQPDVKASFTNNSATNGSRKTNVVVRTDCVDAGGGPCADHVASSFTKQTREQRENGITPFDVKVSRNGEDGLLTVTVTSVECDAKDTTVCSPPQQEPFTFQVAFDTVPPVVSITPNTPPGLLTGSVIDSSPIASAQFGMVGSQNKTPISVGPDGALTVPYVPPVGGYIPEVSATDAAGNSATVQSDLKIYNFNAGLQIHSMQMNGKDVDLGALSQQWGGTIKDGDVLVAAALPEGIDSSTAALQFEQKNWRSFGFKTTLRDCTRLGNSQAYDVAFSCTPSSTSKNTMMMKFTYTDQYGYSADFYYPAETNFAVGTRPMNLPETIQYLFEYALGIMAALGAAGGLGALAVGSHQYRRTREGVIQQALAGDAQGAIKTVKETKFLQRRLKDKLTAEINANIEEQKRLIKVEEAHGLVNELLVFPGIQLEVWKQIQKIPHDSILNAIVQLSKLLRLDISTHYLDDDKQQGKPDSELLFGSFSNALNRWLELYISTPSKSSSNWDEMQKVWGDEKQEIMETLSALYDMETSWKYHELWARIKKADLSRARRLHTTVIAFAHNKELLIKNGKLQQKVFNELIERNMEITSIAEVILIISTLGFKEVMGFISQIRDQKMREQAYRFVAEQNNLLELINGEKGGISLYGSSEQERVVFGELLQRRYVRGDMESPDQLRKALIIYHLRCGTLEANRTKLFILFNPPAQVVQFRQDDIDEVVKEIKQAELII